MRHEDTLKAIQLRSTIENLDVDPETCEQLLACIPDPKHIPWDLVSETIKSHDEAATSSSLLDNMINYYKEVAVAAEWRLEEAQTLKESLASHTETATVEAWGQ